MKREKRSVGEMALELSTQLLSTTSLSSPLVSVSPNTSAPTKHYKIPTHIPLCVDMDDTLVEGDLLYISFFASLKAKPLLTLYTLFTLFKGIPLFKCALSEISSPLGESLPYNNRVISYIKEERKRGRRVVLATASPKRWADEVANHLGIFDDVLATEGELNLKGENKAKRLLSEFKEFEYIGDSRADISVWRAAQFGKIVSHSLPFIKEVQLELPHVEVL